MLIREVTVGLSGLGRHVMKRIGFTAVSRLFLGMRTSFESVKTKWETQQATPVLAYAVMEKGEESVLAAFLFIQLDFSTES